LTLATKTWLTIALACARTTSCARSPVVVNTTFNRSSAPIHDSWRDTSGNHTRDASRGALLKSSFTDSRLDIDVPLARHAISSVGALGFRIGDLSNPKPAKSADGEVDLTSFAALTTQVDAPAMSDMLNHALRDGPVSLPDAVAMLDTAYLGHVIVLWSWALTQPNPETAESTAVRFRSLDGRDREIAVPRLLLTEPISTLAGAAS
jgi:hypothetical protein